jgi:GNAT superfamily N-acetyltransferase
MPWTLSEDVGEYLSAAGGCLTERAAENTILLHAAAQVRERGMADFGDERPLFGWWQPAGEPVTAAFLHTPPFPVVLTAMPAEPAAELAAELAGTIASLGRPVASGSAGRHQPVTGGSPGQHRPAASSGAGQHRPLAGVNGSPDTAPVFAAAWQARTGCRAKVAMRSRLYRLGHLVPPSPPPAGSARAAGTGDRPLVLGWLQAFAAEAAVHAGDPEQAVDACLARSGITLWHDGGQPVSMAGVTRPEAGHVRIGPVYTPPEFRRRGYGAAVTAAVSQAALDAGVSEVVLFTDLANPVSNAIYQRIGYQPVSDRAVYTFAGP